MNYLLICILIELRIFETCSTGYEDSIRLPNLSRGRHYLPEMPPIMFPPRKMQSELKLNSPPGANAILLLPNLLQATLRREEISEMHCSSSIFSDPILQKSEIRANQRRGDDANLHQINPLRFPRWTYLEHLVIDPVGRPLWVGDVDHPLEILAELHWLV